MGTSVPERVLSKVEKGSDYLRMLSNDCRRETAEEEVLQAEKNLAVGVLLELYAQDKWKQLGMTAREVNAISRLSWKGGYREE